jgi:hypothetical protein
MSTNAKSAIKMMSQLTEIKILKEFERMTGKGQKIQSASRQTLKLPVLGEPKIKEGKRDITQLAEPSVKEFWCANLAADAEKQRQERITMITISLLRLCGFANHATRNGIKKSVWSF